MRRAPCRLIVEVPSGQMRKYRHLNKCKCQQGKGSNFQFTNGNSEVPAYENLRILSCHGRQSFITYLLKMIFIVKDIMEQL